VNISGANGNVTFATLNLGTSGARATNRAVTITGGTGTYSLGAVSIFTSNADGLVATNTDGTINTTSGTVDASGGGAVSIDGPAGLTTLGVTLTRLVSIGGTTPGINLRDTNGVFAVVGSGGTCTSAATCTGGSISGKTGASEATGTPGVRLLNVTNFRLTRVNVSGNNHSGVYGGSVANPSGAIDPSTINGFQLDNCAITGNGDTTTSLPDELGVGLYNLVGSAAGGPNPTSITNTTISNNWEFELQVTNNSGTLTNLQMSSNTIASNGTTGAHGNLVNFLGGGTSVMTLTVTSGTFTGNWNPAAPPAAPTGTAISAVNQGTAHTVNVSGATFSNNNAGVDVSSDPIATDLRFNISNNSFQFSRAVAINSFQNANPPYNRNVNGTIQNNTIGTLGSPGSGSALGNGISVQNEGAITLNFLISGNTIQEVTSFAGISTNVGLGGSATGGGTTNVTITNNVIRNIGSRGIVVQDNQTVAPFPTVCADISGNSFSGIAGQAGNGEFMRVRRLNGTFNVRQLAPTSALNAAELDDTNGFIDPTKINVSGTVNFNAGGCTQPSGVASAFTALGGDEGQQTSTGELPAAPSADLPGWRREENGHHA
jgi:hypothetical protein